MGIRVLIFVGLLACTLVLGSDQIPSQMGKVAGWKDMSLADPELQGEVPSELGKLQGLEESIDSSFPSGPSGPIPVEAMSQGKQEFEEMDSDSDGKLTLEEI